MCLLYYDVMEKEFSELEKKVFDEFTKYYESLDVAIKDPFERIELAEKMLNSKWNKFEYYGDRHLIMEDFWSSLTEKQKLVLLGGFMNNNYVHYTYGKYMEMFQSLMHVLRESEKIDPNDEKIISQMMGEKQKQPDYFR